MWRVKHIGIFFLVFFLWVILSFRLFVGVGVGVGFGGDGVSGDVRYGWW